jgi:hypothetical protein
MFAVPLAGYASVRKTLPAWVRWTSIVGFCATLFSLLISAYPFVDVVNPRAYAAKILGTTVCSNILCFSFYKVRRRSAMTKPAEP